MRYRRDTLVRNSVGLAGAFVLIFSGCSLLGQEQTQQLQQISVFDIHGPDRAVVGEDVTFSLIGFALRAWVRVESRSYHEMDVTVWTDADYQSEAWCATPPLPRLGTIEATIPKEGEYTVRVLQPDGSVLEKSVTIDRRLVPL